MSTDLHATRNKMLAGLIAAIAVLVPLVYLLARYASDSTAAGAATGGGVVLIGFTIAAWRATHRPARATTLERAVTGNGDERDNDVATRSAAVVGVLALLLTGLSSAAVAAGAPGDVVLPILMYALLATAVVSFAILNRTT